MKFGPVPVSEAAGALLAHALKAGGQVFRKGLLLGPGEVAALAAAGLSEVTVARLDPDDVDENAAARALARALVPAPEAVHLRLGPSATGRVNIYATAPGIVGLDAAAITAANRVDPMLSIATLAPHQRVQAGTMVATVKIIAYGVNRTALAEASGSAAGAMRLCKAVLPDATLIETRAARGGAKPGGKGARAVINRVEALGMGLAGHEVTAHEIDALATALAQAPGAMILVLTGSATSDSADVLPAALLRAGGRITRFGMPVDPGNLLMLGDLGGRPVIGLPGCARSPAANGADWVLERIACGVPVSSDDIAAMGVGGLLKESPGRPQPREG